MLQPLRTGANGGSRHRLLRGTVATTHESNPFSILPLFLGGGMLILCLVNFPQEQKDIVYQHSSLESIVPTTEPIKQRKGRVIIISSRWQPAANPGGIRFLNPTLPGFLGNISLFPLGLPRSVQNTPDQWSLSIGGN